MLRVRTQAGLLLVLLLGGGHGLGSPLADSEDYPCGEAWNSVLDIASSHHRIARWRALEESCEGSAVFELRPAWLYTQVDEVTKAEALIRSVLDTDEQGLYRKESLSLLASLQMLAGDLPAALQTSTTLLAEYPSWPEAHRGMGGILMFTGDIKRAITHLERATENASDFVAHRHLAIAYYVDGRYEDVRTRSIPPSCGTRVSLAIVMRCLPEHGQTPVWVSISWRTRSYRCWRKQIRR
jgi:tetratricopeptide (TPR) repeat protein